MTTCAAHNASATSSNDSPLPSSLSGTASPMSSYSPGLQMTSDEECHARSVWPQTTMWHNSMANAFYTDITCPPPPVRFYLKVVFSRFL